MWRKLNHSFVHGAAAYSASALGPVVHGSACFVLACLICVYAGWFPRAYLASFLGGIIVAVVGWAVAGMLSAPGSSAGVFFMVPFALMVILPVGLAGYALGKAIRVLMQRTAAHR